MGGDLRWTAIWTMVRELGSYPAFYPAPHLLFSHLTIDGNLNGYVKGIEIVWLEIGNEKVIIFNSHQGLEAGY